MKRLLYILPLLAILLVGCKEDKWMDWKSQNELWLANNALQPNVVTTESGLQYMILSEGNPTAGKPDEASAVVCTYKGQLINGYQFDASTNTTLYMSSVVEGMREGLKKIHEHGDIILYIPQELGYKDEEMGSEGNLSSRYIPPYSTLIFTVHVTSVSK